MVKNLDEIRIVLCEVFPTAKFPLMINEMKMGDIIEWDSMGNFNLLLAIEEKFSVRFSMEEMSEIKSIIDIVQALSKKNATI